MLRDVNEQRGFLLWGWFGRLRFLSCSGQQQSGYSGKIKNNTEDHEMLVTTTRCKMHLSRASSRDDLCWPRKKKGWCSATDVTLTKCADFCALEKVCPLYEGRTKIDHHIMNERSFVENMGRGMAMTSESIAWKGKLTLLVEANGMRPRENLQKVLRWCRNAYWASIIPCFCWCCPISFASIKEEARSCCCGRRCALDFAHVQVLYHAGFGPYWSRILCLPMVNHQSRYNFLDWTLWLANIWGTCHRDPQY